MDNVDILEPIDMIKLLMSASEQVDEYIRTQQYIFDTDSVDALDPSIVLIDCYKILIDELQRKGIIFTVPFEELMEDWYKASHIYDLYYWINDRHQVALCQSHVEMVEQLSDILQSDQIDDSLLAMWCQVTIPKIGSTDRYIEGVAALLPYINTTDDFTDYLSTLYKTVRDRETDFTQPLDAISAYIKAMGDGQVIVKKAFQILSSSPALGNLYRGFDVDKFAKELDYYDTDKLEPLTISRQTWAWCSKHNYKDYIQYDDLPEDMQKLCDDLHNEHHTTANHHPEYYLVNKDVPIDLKAMSLLAVTMASDGDGDPEKTKSNYAGMLVILGDRLPEENKRIMDTMMKALLAEMPIKSNDEQE